MIIYNLFQKIKTIMNFHQCTYILLLEPNSGQIICGKSDLQSANLNFEKALLVNYLNLTILIETNDN